MIRQLGVTLDRESALTKNIKVSSSKKVNTDVFWELSVFLISYLAPKPLTRLLSNYLNYQL